MVVAALPGQRCERGYSRSCDHLPLDVAREDVDGPRLETRAGCRIEFVFGVRFEPPCCGVINRRECISKESFDLAPVL